MTDLANAHFKPLRRKTSTRAALSFIGLQLTWPNIGEVTRRRPVRATCAQLIVASVRRRSTLWGTLRRRPGFNHSTPRCLSDQLRLIHRLCTLNVIARALKQSNLAI